MLLEHFRKKPVVIEAVQYDGTNATPICLWICGSPLETIAAQEQHRVAWVSETGVLHIQTLESETGFHVAAVGDWIIRGVVGEFYPCKPDVFARTYHREP